MPATYIADLPAAASLGDGDALPLDTGSATLKATVAQLRAGLAADTATLTAEPALAADDSVAFHDASADAPRRLSAADLAAGLAPLFALGAIPEEAVNLRPLGTAAYLDASQIPPSVVVSTVDDDRTLSGIDAGKLLVCTAAATVTLPGVADDGMEAGWVVWIKNRSGGAVTVECAVGDLLDGAAAPLTLANAASVMVAFAGPSGFESV